ncbi:C2 calcium-dependent domain-containing protein 4C-like [Asterias rubens]|uniref:C2 calcium-dependent domain-containing protein 4C-like n=1 Tax=Asterias rubens TaxID=7604 RepID=UPI001455D181|nr:C2 calcium-dependent domain-containing protein 4C-like [Asterias rubens]
MESSPDTTPVLVKRSSTQLLAVLTPKTIPKFVIPHRRPGQASSPVRTGPAGKRSSRKWSSDSDYSSGSAMLDEYDMSSPVHGSPYHHQGKSNDCINGFTPSDPGYTLAMTLRHLPKNYTKYGFSTLSASPKTNRTESMFLPKANVLSNKLETCRFTDNVFDSPGSAKGRRTTPTRRGLFPASRTYLDTDSSENSDDDSSAEDGLLRFPRSYSNDQSRSWAKTQRTRRNGVNLLNQQNSDGDEYLSDQSSIEGSPVLRRHATKHCRRNLPEEDPDNKRSLALQELHLTCARQLYGTKDQYSTDMGGIEICLRYDRAARQLMVLLIRGENIGSQHALFPKRVCSFVKLSINQSFCKVQKSNTAKNTSDPYFDEEFAFHNISPVILKNSHLRLQVFLEGLASKLRLKNSTNIGEVRLRLAEVEQNGYVHVKEDLKHKKHFTVPKRMNVGLSYRANNRVLTVVVVKAQNLIDGIMSRGSNCCVEVQLTQVGSSGGLDTDVRQSSVRRLTNSPVFKDAFTFRLNETQNIRDGLMVVCRIVHRKPFRKNTTIGQVQFGIGSTRLSETIQWTNLLRNLGRPITQWHALSKKGQ